MALRDHFRPPLSALRHWHAFHNAWATYLASDLNRRLPEGYFAEPNVQFGIEIDVAAFEESGEAPQAKAGSDSPMATGWTPPAPVQTLPFQAVTDTVEVSVFNHQAGPVLAGVIELVSPANKDRPAHRAAFVSRCETYLQQGVGLVVVDVVTGRRANPHRELLERLASPNVSGWDAELYATAYRVTEHDGQASLEVWQEALAVGRGLPTMPLWLRGDLCLPIDLDATYEQTCREQRITDNGA